VEHPQNAELNGLVIGPKAEKRIPSNLGGRFATQKCSKWAPRLKKGYHQIWEADLQP